LDGWHGCCIYSGKTRTPFTPEPAMSLSTQLHRGTLALPMLLLFAVLALVANEQVDAHPTLDAKPGLALAHGLDATASVATSACARPGLLLGHAPADLAPLAQRNGSCRA
jgi:hypothetical protein